MMIGRVGSPRSGTTRHAHAASVERAIRACAETNNDIDVDAPSRAFARDGGEKIIKR